MRRWSVVFVILISIIVSSTGTFFGMKWYGLIDSDGDHGHKTYFPEAGGIPKKDFNKIEKAYQLILNEYVDDVSGKELIEGAVEGMVEKLNDPYSVYMDEKKSTDFNQSLDSSFEGIGAEISEVNGKIIIVSPFKNSPAERAGLKPFDQIIGVDGETVEGQNIYEVTMRIRGEKGTGVQLEILRDGLSEPITVEVKRDQIPIETVFSKMIETTPGSFGYIEITSFSKDTGKDFGKQLAVLEGKNMDGLIIDVRGNPGGLLGSVEEVVKHLVTDKKPYVQIEQKSGKRDQIFTQLRKPKPYPIVVLTDKGSASASEILAAALKEGEGYKVIGEKTFGKGTVQQQVELGDKTHIKLTMYKWLTPDGNWVHQTGLEPDINVLPADLYRLHPLQITSPLKKDMTHEQVEHAQKILKSIGHEPGRMDGYFSESTEISVRNFQREYGLSVTGIIDEQTAKEMEKAVLLEREKIENDRQLQMAVAYLRHEKND